MNNSLYYLHIFWHDSLTFLFFFFFFFFFAKRELRQLACFLFKDINVFCLFNYCPLATCFLYLMFYSPPPSFTWRIGITHNRRLFVWNAFVSLQFTDPPLKKGFYLCWESYLFFTSWNCRNIVVKKCPWSSLMVYKTVGHTQPLALRPPFPRLILQIS